MRNKKNKTFPSALEDARAAELSITSPQTLSPSYRLAYTDQDFLLREELRPVRLELELLKPELILNEHQIENTIVIFGSTRNEYITPELCFQFHYFAIRKMHFLMRAKALVVFPGGFGTLDEPFETLTLIQTKKIKPMPVLIFGREFWERVISFDALVEEGTISREDIKLFQYVETAEEAWKIISRTYAER